MRFSRKVETKAPWKAFGARPAGDGASAEFADSSHGTGPQRSAGERSIDYARKQQANGLEQTLNAQSVGTLSANGISTTTIGAQGTATAIKTHVLTAAEQLLAQKATRFYIQWFVSLTIIEFGIAAIGLNLFATPGFRYACFFGMAFPAATSFVSFLLTEWAFDQPSLIFLSVAIGSMVVRMFNLLLVFAVGLLIIKFSMFGLLVGLLGSFLTYMVIEIMYIHNKGSLLGH